MASPLLFFGVLGGAYLFYQKVIAKAGKAAPGDTGATVTANGITFQARIVQGSSDGNSAIVDVFTKDGSRIVRYEQVGTGASRVRTELTSPPGVDPAIKAAAMKAFAIRPKA